MIWKHLGFKRDIFFVEPLRPDEEDMKLFVGRDAEIKRYLIDTLSGSRALKIVTGEIGVGKTTFVNACQYYIYKGLPFEFEFDIPSYLPCFEKLQIKDSDTIDGFIQQAIISICKSIAIHCRSNSIELHTDVKKLLTYFTELEINSGGGGISIGATVAGTGAQLGKSNGIRTQNVIKNARHHLKRLVEIVLNDFKLKGIAILVNNLDILLKDKLVQFFNEARDELFDLEGLYWTFIGRKGLGSIVETEAQRVADYLSGTDLFLEPLDIVEIRKMIQVRVEGFRNKSSLKCPLPDEMINAIYFLSMQEARETLKICGEIVRRVMTVDPSNTIIPYNIASSTLVNYIYDRSKEIELTEAKVRVLTAVYENHSCRPKDYQAYGYSSSQGFISALKGLVNKRLLSVEVRGQARIYKMTGMTLIAAITGALGNEIKKAAIKKLEDSFTSDIIESREFTDAQLMLELNGA